MAQEKERSGKAEPTTAKQADATAEAGESRQKSGQEEQRATSARASGEDRRFNARRFREEGHSILGVSRQNIAGALHGVKDDETLSVGDLRQRVDRYVNGGAA